MKPNKSVRIGVLGFGNIGSSVVELISKNRKTITRKSGLVLEVVSIADPMTKNKHPLLVKQAEKVINDPSIDVIVEAIGGIKPALQYILAALKNKKHVVTSNKELVALHAEEILKTARENNVCLFYEAAVGGGIPILQPLKEGLYANNVTEVSGIVNGTTNYILSCMTNEKMKFSEALQRAKEQGYAEPNPKNDVEGYDAAYKAVLLALMAFGVHVNFKDVYFEGITKITQDDISYADGIGYAIKLLAVAKHDNGELEVHVYPIMLPKEHPLASVSGPMNAMYIKGDAVGDLMFYGQGAGGSPTSSAVVNDIILTQKREAPNKVLTRAKIKDMGNIKSRYYVHLTVPDKSGVLAKISDVFGQENVSIQTVFQKEVRGNTVPLIIILHDVVEKNFNRALSKIKKLSVVQKVDNVIRVGF
ncbi:MAG: homoserine dehydrogenase [Candidatus Saganbacteria bacterium]|nr:homoserine dehydrogenase [Candidatus Saganbacteria bacterium]